MTKDIQANGTLLYMYQRYLGRLAKVNSSALYTLPELEWLKHAMIVVIEDATRLEVMIFLPSIELDNTLDFGALQ